jgi:hypothetical protein
MDVRGVCRAVEMEGGDWRGDNVIRLRGGANYIHLELMQGYYRVQYGVLNMCGEVLSLTVDDRTETIV